MSTTDKSSKLLSELFSAYSGNELAAIDTIFSYIQSNTNLLNDNQSINNIQNIALKYTKLAQSSQKNQTAAIHPTSSSSNSSSIASTTQQSPTITNNTSTNKPNNSAEKTDSGKLKPTPGRGAVFDSYTWSQSLESVECIINLPTTIKRSQIDIDIDSDKLYVKLGNDIIINDKLNHQIDASDATWTIETNKSGRTINVYLPKSNKYEWWNKLVESDSEIDIQLIEGENSNLSDLDSDTRSAVEKMMYEQRMKQQQESQAKSKINLPATSDKEKNDALRRFMELHPEMDFSKAKISM